jgi:hypothetical protein
VVARVRRAAEMASRLCTLHRWAKGQDLNVASEGYPLGSEPRWARWNADSRGADARNATPQGVERKLEKIIQRLSQLVRMVSSSASARSVKERVYSRSTPNLTGVEVGLTTPNTFPPANALASINANVPGPPPLTVTTIEVAPPQGLVAGPTQKLTVYATRVTDAGVGARNLNFNRPLTA